MKEVLRQGWAIVLITLIVGFSVCFAQPVWAINTAAVNPANGAQVFELHCAGCHVNGGNIVRRGKNLKLKTLQRQNVDSVETIAQIVTNGRGIMSAYSDRLTPQEIQAVAAYVLEQAEQDWKH